jgi:hypothetical protein
MLLGAWISSWLMAPSLAFVDAGTSSPGGGEKNVLADWGPIDSGMAIVRNEGVLPEPLATKDATRVSVDQ